MGSCLRSCGAPGVHLGGQATCPWPGDPRRFRRDLDTAFLEQGSPRVCRKTAAFGQVAAATPQSLRLRDPGTRG